MEFDDTGNRERVERMRRRGVDAWGPERVYVSGDVELDRIAPGAVIRQATLSGATLSISSGARIGVSGHAEVSNCQIGKDVELGAGLYDGATFLEGVKVRGFAEIRSGTLIEEQAEAAHSVALKNTTFTCCCVAGSLINFCDLFLSGGTSRRDHTEIGSGAVHFNFDPRGDKWGSLIGGIRGVLLRSDPIFIGGNCGLVGPLEVGFGAVTAAGSIVRRNVPDNAVVASGPRDVQRRQFDRRAYGSIRGRVLSTAKLVGTLRALDAWYETVRIPGARQTELPLYAAARERIQCQIGERIRRVGKIVNKLPRSIAAAPDGNAARIQDQRHFVERWEEIRAALEERVVTDDPPARFVQAYVDTRAEGAGHVSAVQTVQVGIAETANWLEGLVEKSVARVTAILA